MISHIDCTILLVELPANDSEPSQKSRGLKSRLHFDTLMNLIVILVGSNGVVNLYIKMPIPGKLRGDR